LGEEIKHKYTEIFRLPYNYLIKTKNYNSIFKK
jgi:2-oxo-4-hydroxy-4-carboxy--5-ureidoimidazoline (OHCU) decarboxylase